MARNNLPFGEEKIILIKIMNILAEIMANTLTRYFIATFWRHAPLKYQQTISSGKGQCPLLWPEQEVSLSPQ